MSGPYDQQALAQVSGFSAASNKTTNVNKNRQRVQPGGDSSTSLSSAESAKGAKGAGTAVAGVITTAHNQQQQQQQVLSGSGSAVGHLDHGGVSTGSLASGQRRPGRVHRQTFQLPDICGQVRQVRRRELTPEPDTIERIYLQRARPEIIEEITEIPTTPPPIIRQQNIVEPAGPPQVIKRVVRVPPRGGGAAAGVGAGFGGGFQSDGNLLSAGSYGNVQQAGAAASYGGAVGGGYAAPAPAPVGAVDSHSASFGGAVGGGYAAPAPAAVGGFGSYGGGFGGAAAPAGGSYAAPAAVGGFGSYGAGFGGAVGGGYAAPAPAPAAVGGFGSYGAGFGGQQSFGGFGAAQVSQPVRPPMGLHQAFCFHV